MLGVRSRRLLRVAVAIPLAATLTVPAAASGGSSMVRTSGQVGPLHLDRSTRADVIAWLGTPLLDVTGQFQSGGSAYYPPYEALTYGCGGKCTSTFYVNSRTLKLVALDTISPEFVGPDGLRVGMSTAEAQRRAHRRMQGGCFTGFYYGASRHHKSEAEVFLDDTSARYSRRRGWYRGHLDEMSIESNRHPVGLLGTC